MALNAYLKVKGQKQGDFRGGVIQKGKEGQILVTAWTHSIVSPRDASSGLATGRRQHGVLRVTRPTDQSTIAFYVAMINNEPLSVELMCWEPNRMGTAGGSGAEMLSFTIQLANAHVAEINAGMPSTQAAETQSLPQYEELAFTYESITWTYKTGNKVASDTWQQPSV